MDRGILMIITGPGGAGKDTVLQKAVARSEDVVVAVSHTTRPMRPGEQEGVHYFFVNHEQFLEMMAQGKFLEDTKRGSNYYGVGRDQVQDHLDAGKNVLLILDIDGSKTVKELCPEAVFVFLMPPSSAERKRRLVARGDDAEHIEFRLKAAEEEIDFGLKSGIYDYFVFNVEVDKTVGRLLGILNTEQQLALTVATEALVF